MALSLLYTPGEYFSAHGDLIFTLLEDTKPFASGTYPDYKYVCDIYIGGVQVARLKAFPRPGDKLGIFNIGNVVRNYLAVNFAPASNNLRAQQIGENNFYVNVICRFGEEYGNITYSNIIIDTQRTYFNHYNGRMAGQLSILPARLDKTCSLRPLTSTIDRNAKFCFMPFLATDDTTINLVIRAFNGSIEVSNTTQPFTPTAASSNEMQLFNISPTAINAAVPGFINSYIEYYTVTFSTTNITDDVTLRLNLTCEAKYEVFSVHFLNRYGGFESKDFSKVSRKTMDITKSDFGKLPYTISTDGVPHYFNDSLAYNEQRSVYAGTWKEKMKLNTDLLPDDEYNWLQDLILSPAAYIEMFNVFYPIIISDNNYEFKKNINDDLTNLTINIEFGDRFNTQYR